MRKLLYCLVISLGALLWHATLFAQTDSVGYNLRFSSRGSFRFDLQINYTSHGRTGVTYDKITLPFNYDSILNVTRFDSIIVMFDSSANLYSQVFIQIDSTTPQVRSLILNYFK